MGLIELTTPPPPLPTVTIINVGFQDPGTTGSAFVEFEETDATTYSVALYQSSNDTTYVAIFTSSNQTPDESGSNAIFFGGTVVDYWYYWSVSVTNETGTASGTSEHLKNEAGAGGLTLSLSQTQFYFPGTYEAVPYTSATITGSADQIQWSLYLDAGEEEPILRDSGTIYGPLDTPQIIQPIETIYTPGGAQYFYVAEAAGEDGKDSEVSDLSIPNPEPA
jgi:hypothetical protein